jgi:4a-hydroxytetrahydrobiopterin dehydratase
MQTKNRPQIHPYNLDLAHQSCTPCQIGAPKLTTSELEAALPELPGWSVIDNHHLSRTLRFKDFQSALDWVNAAGQICEQEGHHAEFRLGWGVLMPRFIRTK